MSPTGQVRADEAKTFVTMLNGFNIRNFKRERENEEKLRHNKYLRWHIISHIHNSQVVESFPKIVNYVLFKDFF
mgnify:FL=1